MPIVRLGIKNPNDLGVENDIYIDNSEIEARVSNRWSKVQGNLDCTVYPSGVQSKMILLPAQADRCRVSLISEK